MMTEITYIANNQMWVSLALFLASLYFLITYQRGIETDKLIDYFTYLNTKFLLMIFLIMFGLIFILEFTVDNPATEQFFNQNIEIVLYYVIITFGVLFLIKFIYYGTEFFKKQDLFGLSYLDKTKISKGKNKK